MSAKEGATIAWKPKSSSAQGACSREEPQPKLRPGDEDRVRLQLDLAVADPVVEEELAEAGPLDPLEELLGDDLVGVDVGAVEHRDLALDDVQWPHAQLQSLMSTKCPSIGRRGGHLRADQVGAPTLALAALEVAVRGRGAALALGERVGVHPQAHRAARLAPFEAGAAEDIVQALGFGRGFDLLGAGDDHRADAVGDLAAVDDRGGLAQVLDPRVGAGADEDPFGRDLGHRRAGLQAHVGERALGRFAVGRRVHLRPGRGPRR